MQIVAGRVQAKTAITGSAVFSLRGNHLRMQVSGMSREALAAVIEGFLAPGENTQGLSATIRAAAAVTVVLTTDGLTAGEPV